MIMGDGSEIGKDVFTANELFFSCFLTLVALAEYPCPCRKNSMDWTSSREKAGA